MENKMESESMNDDTKAIDATRVNIAAMKPNEKLINRSINRLRGRLKTSLKYKWKIAHGRIPLIQNKNKNGYRGACHKNIKMNSKPFLSLTETKSSIKMENYDVNKQNSEHKLPELCRSSADCRACKEKFLDRLELHKHATIAHPDVSIKFCDLCDETFFNDNELYNHTLEVHSELPKITEELNDLNQLDILNELEKIEECSSENIPENIQTTNELMNESDSQVCININAEKISIEPLEFIEDVRSESIKNLSHAVKVQIAERDNVIFSYTPLDEKKEYCPKDYENCHETNETSVLKCKWSSPKHSFDENIHDSLIKNETDVNNCLTPSVEEFQDIEELESSCELDDTNKIQHLNQMENDNFTCDKNDIQLIYNISNESIIDSIGVSASEQDAQKELSMQEFNEKLPNELDTLSSRKSSSSSSICRTYSAKINSQVLKKSPSMIHIKKDEINFCVMCREIFSLIEQKSINTDLDAESIFKCPLCSRQFTARSSLEKHVAYYHLNCECTKTVKSAPSIALEMTVSPKLYECILCPAAFTNYNGLNNHILTLHEPMPPFKDRLTIGKPEYLRTVRCTYMESKLSSVKNKNSNENVSILNCPSCKLTFCTCDEYILHVKESHNYMTPIENTSWTSVETSQMLNDSAPHNLINDKTQLCEMYNSNTNDLIENVKSPSVIKNSNEPRKTCKRCNKEFETVRDLSEHFYFSHDDTMESQAIMAAASSADKRTHDWRCLHCSQRFKVLQSYIRHRFFVHNDESMVHVCENCCKILTSITMVNVHVCLNVSSWECKPCNQTFQNAIELRLHNTASHMETPGPHTCPICEKRFLTMTMLTRHHEAKKCYPRLRPPEKPNSQNRINERPKRNVSTGKKGKISPAVKKVKKEYPRVQDLPNMRVIQEDVFIREARDKANSSNKNYSSSSASSKSQQNDEIYQCSMCKLYFLSKAGLKIHLSRAHTSAVEICQLCYKMFVTGNLVRHIADNHLKHDNNNQAYYEAMRVKQHNIFQINEHDIERDTEELISTIGITQLLGLCEYQRFTDQSDDNDRFCPDCPLAFDNSEKYRRHYVQTHDKLCALCNMEFETGQDAARHKTRIHGSMACYVWFAHKLIAAISDTKTFSEMAEKIITDTIPIEKTDLKMEIEDNEKYSSDVTEEVEINGINEKTDECSNNIWIENYSLKENNLYEMSNTFAHTNHLNNQINDVATVVYNNYYNDVDHEENDDQDEYKLFILVTENDLEKYKHNISELARQIHSTCNVFSINQIETMLEPFTNE